MKDLKRENISILRNGRGINEFDELLDESWQTKRSLSTSVSHAHLELTYIQAASAGTIGGKEPFKFEFSRSQIKFFDPEDDCFAVERTRTNQSSYGFCELAQIQMESRA